MVSSSSLIKVGPEAGALGLVVQASFNITLYIVQSKAGFVCIKRIGLRMESARRVYSMGLRTYFTGLLH